MVKGRTIRRRAYLATGIRSLLSCGRYRTVSELEALYPKGSRHSIWYIPCLHIRDYLKKPSPYFFLINSLMSAYLASHLLYAAPEVFSSAIYLFEWVEDIVTIELIQKLGP